MPGLAQYDDTNRWQRRRSEGGGEWLWVRPLSGYAAVHSGSTLAKSHRIRQAVRESFNELIGIYYPFPLMCLLLILPPMVQSSPLGLGFTEMWILGIHAPRKTYNYARPRLRPCLFLFTRVRNDDNDERDNIQDGRWFIWQILLTPREALFEY